MTIEPIIIVTLQLLKAIFKETLMLISLTHTNDLPIQPLAKKAYIADETGT